MAALSRRPGLSEEHPTNAGVPQFRQEALIGFFYERKK
jgi:hypothetical protein